MANNDELFNGAAFAIGTQTSGFGTVDSAVAALSGAIAFGNGIILGDAAFGDAESGITLPTFSSEVRKVNQQADSLTQQADNFIRSITEGLSITFPLKGNGADAGAPDADAAKPHAGIDELLGAAGLVGATGAADPDYAYTPRATTEWATVKIWVADLSWVLQDCTVDVLTLDFTPGGHAFITADISVGSINAFADTVTFPTFTWGSQRDLAPPVVEGMAFDVFGQVRGFESLKISIANNIVKFKDANVATTGERLSQVDRVITVDGRIYLETADSAAEYDALIATADPTADLTMQLGNPDVGGAETDLNAVLINVNNLQQRGIKYDRTGTAAAVEFTGAKATGLTAGTEFLLEYN